MKIKWLGHAAFLIQSDGLRIITDPYESGARMTLPPITEPADIVIRSSDDDSFHSYIGSIPPGFELVTATEIVDIGATVHGIEVRAIWSQESLSKEVVRDNAMYRFTLEGINIAHMGDVGNPLTESQMEALQGTDLLFALAGGPPTIELPDLKTVIETIKPKIVIPMHYSIPGPQFSMLPVSDFAGLYPADQVDWLDSSDVTITKETLPDDLRIIVMKPAFSPQTEP